MEDDQLQQLLKLAEKESILAKLVVWLKAKKLWEEAKKDIGLELKDEDK